MSTSFEDESGATRLRGRIVGGAAQPFALGDPITTPTRISTDNDGALVGTDENGSTTWILHTKAVNAGLQCSAPAAALGVVDTTVGRGVVVVPSTFLYLLRGYTSSPNDADLNAGDLALWYDATAGAAKLKIRARDANGTVVSGEVALAP